MPSFAYLFERFPSFVQTFVYREAQEMVRQKMEPWLVSIRRPDDAAELTCWLLLQTEPLPKATGSLDCASPAFPRTLRSG